MKKGRAGASLRRPPLFNVGELIADGPMI